MRTMLVSLTFVFLACTTAFGQCPCCTQRADLLRPSSRADATSQKSVIIKGERWANGSKIKVCFLSGSEPQRLAVVEAFLEWTKYANLERL